MTVIKLKIGKDGVLSPVDDKLTELDPILSPNEQTAIIAENFVYTQEGRDWFYDQMASLSSSLKGEPIRLSEYLKALSEYDLTEFRQRNKESE